MQRISYVCPHCCGLFSVELSPVEEERLPLVQSGFFAPGQALNFNATELCWYRTHYCPKCQEQIYFSLAISQRIFAAEEVKKEEARRLCLAN